MRLILILAVLFATYSMPSKASEDTLRMVQCESCSTMGALKNAAIARGDGAWVVFSIGNGVIARYTVHYEPELGRNIVALGTVPPAMEDAFALMMNADERIPHILSGGQQTVVGNINVIGTGHNPVEISLNGEHDDAYGNFIADAQSCLSIVSCANQINPALGDLAGAESLLNGFGISIFGNGGNINWENLPPGFKIWLCDQNRDCALLEYDKENNRWEYKETRGEGGQGARYPRYGESLQYRFGNSGEASLFERGLEGGGMSVHGTWSIRTVLVCVSAGGGQASCEFVTVAQ